jgi:hypothetical protein
MFGKIRNLVNEINARVSTFVTIAGWDLQEQMERHAAHR